MLKVVKQDTNFFKKTKNIKKWEDVNYILKDKIRNSLLDEQQNMCAYCEKKIKPNENNIDHFRTRNLFGNLTFEYDNLFVSCNTLKQCSHHKDNFGLKKEDFESFYSPLNINLDEFEYIGGEIFGKTKKAQKTIEIFNLNSYDLVNQRKVILQNFEYYKFMSIEELFECFEEFKTYLIFLKGNQ